MKPWTIALLSTLILGAATLWLHREHRRQTWLEERRSILQNAALAARRLHDERGRRVRQVARITDLLAQARDLGLTPEDWVINHLDLNTETQDLPDLLQNDPILLHLRKSLESVARNRQKELDALPPRTDGATSAKARAIEERAAARSDALKARIAQRTLDLERSTSYTPRSMQELIRFLSAPEIAFGTPKAGRDALFLPQMLSTRRISENHHSLHVKGIFFIPRH
jgi:hypothetical protein